MYRVLLSVGSACSRLLNQRRPLFAYGGNLLFFSMKLNTLLVSQYTPYKTLPFFTPFFFLFILFYLSFWRWSYPRVKTTSKKKKRCFNTALKILYTWAVVQRAFEEEKTLSECISVFFSFFFLNLFKWALPDDSPCIPVVSEVTAWSRKTQRALPHAWGSANWPEPVCMCVCVCVLASPLSLQGRLARKRERERGAWHTGFAWRLRGVRVWRSTFGDDANDSITCGIWSSLSAVTSSRTMRARRVFYWGSRQRHVRKFGEAMLCEARCFSAFSRYFWCFLKLCLTQHDIITKKREKVRFCLYCTLFVRSNWQRVRQRVVLETSSYFFFFAWPNQELYCSSKMKTISLFYSPSSKQLFSTRGIPASPLAWPHLCNAWLFCKYMLLFFLS